VQWPDDLLRMFLSARDRDTVSGDLLEGYRSRVEKGVSPAHAKAWYWRQVVGFILRRIWLPAFLFALAAIVRGCVDWFAPPAELSGFFIRSAISTYVEAGILLGTAIVASWRSRLFEAGIMASVGAAGVAGVIIVLCQIVILTVRHDPITMAAIERSGGLEEAFLLPLMMVFPAAVLGLVGGLAGVLRAHLGERVL
jgi:hypothetical protein